MQLLIDRKTMLGSAGLGFKMAWGEDQIMLRQIAWLDFHGGRWHLVTASALDRDRMWANRDEALSDLEAEGWAIDGPHGKQPTMRHDADRHIYGYALMRTMH